MMTLMIGIFISLLPNQFPSEQVCAQTYYKVNEWYYNVNTSDCATKEELASAKWYKDVWYAAWWVVWIEKFDKGDKQAHWLACRLEWQEKLELLIGPAWYDRGYVPSPFGLVDLEPYLIRMYP